MTILAVVSVQTYFLTFLDSTKAHCPSFNLQMADKLTEEEIAEYQDAFDVFDKDRDGKITVQELGMVMRNLMDKPPTEDELQDMLREWDTDGNGTIDLQEFLAMMMAKNSSGRLSKEEHLEAFKAFDKNNDGFIDREELKRVMDALDQGVTDQEVEEMINMCDINGDGKVDFHEFVNMMTHFDEPNNRKQDGIF